MATGWATSTSARRPALYYREKIEFPFFLYYLKGKGDGKFPKAWLFQTGMNQWRKFDAWPPKRAEAATDLFLDAKGKLVLAAAGGSRRSTSISPIRTSRCRTSAASCMGVLNSYMTEDQRFAATRPDVLVYKTEPLDHDVTVFGPISVDLKVSTTGTDSDFVVKVIDVYPGDYSGLQRCRRAGAGAPPAAARRRSCRWAAISN